MLNQSFPRRVTQYEEVTRPGPGYVLLTPHFASRNFIFPYRKRKKRKSKNLKKKTENHEEYKSYKNKKEQKYYRNKVY